MLHKKGGGGRLLDHRMTRPLDDDPAPWIGRAYDRHGAGLFRYALMLLGDTAGAADVVQQVFLALVRNSRGAEGVDHEDRYLRRAVRNECFSALRRRRREPAGAGGDSPLVESIASTHDDPELRAVIDQALRALPQDQREVVHPKVFEGRTFQEIADLSDESINTIASRYRCALDKLRAHLQVRK
jgi:RNA polymerase sigma-70 factor (ECF subfamily)